MADGSWGLPAYHEFIEKHGIFLQLRSDGAVRSAERMQKYEGGWLQPAVAALSPRTAVALLRSASESRPFIGVNRSADGGATWSLGHALEIPNPDASVALLRLCDGTLLLAANPTRGGRGTLQLFTSTDDGATWAASRVIERDDSGEFSYPCLAESPDGIVHLTYTWRRQGIRLCSFGRGWLRSDGLGDPMLGGGQ
jgi:predicted neuraminidase